MGNMKYDHESKIGSSKNLSMCEKSLKTLTKNYASYNTKSPSAKHKKSSSSFNMENVVAKSPNMLYNTAGSNYFFKSKIKDKAQLYNVAKHSSNSTSGFLKKKPV